ncbi:DUF3124 domain-containing protein [Calothrix sp. UHCC 0171]|uniref:DUF3124 domain-containing protein n=1 Tax=Calothrix sp. UHCC 0171 TaxID=3110245 RepID=UPI002B201BA1|nr:DUF3124 domain-containing protein [Calothrix sp. UHCC 0171]MEA5573397.1 DUF3124 domain-containing protein [Calothrix sp. UHCC 0171]
MSRTTKSIVIQRVAIVSIIYIIMLLTACDTTKNNAPSQTANSPTPVPSLTRIAQDGTSVSITSNNQITVSKGQIIYVPVYSHIYHGNKQEQLLLTVTLSIRNTSLTDPIVIRSVRYYDSTGKLVKKQTEGNLQLSPLATTEFFIPQQDVSGGSGANFIVEWVAETKSVTEPIVEAVMISTSFQQGVSFTTSGKVIQELKP